MSMTKAETPHKYLDEAINLIQLKSDHSSLQSYDFENSPQMAESQLLGWIQTKKNE